MKAILQLILLVLAIILLILLAACLVLLWGLAVGGLVIRLPWFAFTLFEATVLALLASLPIFYLAGNILYAMFKVPLTNLPNDIDIEDYEPWLEYEIPQTRFMSNGRHTGESTVRYELANNINIAFQAAPNQKGHMNKQQLRELSVRLAELAVPLLKKKPRNAKRITISLSALKQQIQKVGQQPYDDDILRLAVMTINELLDEDEEVADIVRYKMWQEIVH
jgi:hypothetical protein